MPNAHFPPTPQSIPPAKQPTHPAPPPVGPLRHQRDGLPLQIIVQHCPRGAASASEAAHQRQQRKALRRGQVGGVGQHHRHGLISGEVRGQVAVGRLVGRRRVGQQGLADWVNQRAADKGLLSAHLQERLLVEHCCRVRRAAACRCHGLCNLLPLLPQRLLPRARFLWGSGREERVAVLFRRVSESLPPQVLCRVALVNSPMQSRATWKCTKPTSAPAALASRAAAAAAPHQARGWASAWRAAAWPGRAPILRQRPATMGREGLV